MHTEKNLLLNLLYFILTSGRTKENHLDPDTFFFRTLYTYLKCMSGSLDIYLKNVSESRSFYFVQPLDETKLSVFKTSTIFFQCMRES